MKYLTYGESEAWLASMSATLDHNRNVVFSGQTRRVILTVPSRTLPLSFFSKRLADWLPSDSEKLLWFSNWTTEPSHQLALIEQLRLDRGELQSLIEFPGQVFGRAAGVDKDMLKGIAFLIMSFNFEAYIISRDNSSHIYLGDDYIVFSSGSEGQLEDAVTLAKDFDLRIVTDIRSAWQAG